MTITIKASQQAQQILISVPKHILKHKVGLKAALHDIGFDVVKDTKRLIVNGPKTGRIYSFRGARHQASAPGEPPANRSGRLARSGDYKVRNWQEMVVGETAEYAGYLENGTRRIAPRPHLIRAIMENERNTINAILDNIKREIQ